MDHPVVLIKRCHYITKIAVNFEKSLFEWGSGVERYRYSGVEAKHTMYYVLLQVTTVLSTLPVSVY